MELILEYPSVEKCQKEIKKKRDSSLDLMRLFGILIILIAHSHPPAWLFQLRNFGTPFLIVVSALTYSKIYSNKKLRVKEFYLKRISKLIVPTWIFLTIFFSSIYILDLSYAQEINLNYILHSFLLSGEKVGYLTIFRIYIFLAIITPVALYFKSLINSVKVYYFILLTAYFVYEVVIGFAKEYVAQDLMVYLRNILGLIPFTLVYLYGLRLSEIKKKTIFLISIISLITFLGFAINYFLETGKFIQTQTSKNPATIYYLSYAFFCINLLYIFITLPITEYLPKKLVTWLSENSLWIYLWHVLGIEIYNNFNFTINNQLVNFIFMLGFIIVFAITIYSIQKKLVEFVMSKYNNRALNTLGSYLK